MNNPVVKESLTTQPSDTPLTDALDAELTEREIDRALDFARTLERELAAAIAQRDEKDRQLADCYNRMCNAEVQRDKAKEDALEEAAKVCENEKLAEVFSSEDKEYNLAVSDCAAAIRAMKECGK